MDVRFTDQELEELADRLVAKLLPLLRERLRTDDEFLTSEEACSLLKCNRSWLYKKVQSGEIPCIRMGKYLRFSRRELERWNRQSQVRCAEPVLLTKTEKKQDLR